jgi:hypothetical protein
MRDTDHSECATSPETVRATVHLWHQSRGPAGLHNTGWSVLLYGELKFMTTDV